MTAQANQFIGCDKPFDEAKAVLFGAPYDSTTSFRPGTYAELEYASVAEDVVATANDARMRELHAEVVVAQVRMCVEMDYVQVRVALRDGADAAERD